MLEPSASPIPTPPVRREDLPVWMLPRRRRLDWGLWIVIGFCLLVSAPLLGRPGLPLNNNTELSEYRSVEVMRLVQSSVFYSRWAAGLHYGQGSPAFNYLAPLPHYVAGYIEALTDTGPVTTAKLLIYLSMIAAGVSMYQFARQRWGAAAGVVAATAYIFSTPMAFTLPYVSGDVGLLMGMALLPFALTLLDELWLKPTRRRFAVAVVAVGLFILCDARLTLFGSLIGAASLISLNWRPDATLKAYREPILAILLGIVLTAFYWLPAIVERDQIRWQSINNDPLSGSISLSELISPIPRNDISLLNVQPSRGIGASTLVLGGIGAAALFFKLRQRENADSVEFMFIAIVLMIAVLPIAADLWPSPTLFQPILPYHGVLIATFCLSVVAAHSVRWLELGRFSEYWPGLLVFIAVVLALPAFYPPDWNQRIAETDTGVGSRAELQGIHVGSFRIGILLPMMVPTLTDPPTNILDELKANHYLRQNPRNDRSNSNVSTLDQGPVQSHYLIKTDDPVNVVLNTFNFIGWVASTNGLKQPVQNTPDGYQQIAVPANTTDVLVWLEDTPIQNFSWILSWGTLIVLILMQWQQLGSRPVITAGSPKYESMSFLFVQPLLSRRQAWVAGMVFGFALCALFFINGFPDVILPRAQLGKFPGATPIPQSIANTLIEPSPVSVLAYSVDSAATNATDRTITVRAGETITMTLYWQPHIDLPIDYQSELQMVSLSQSDQSATPSTAKSAAWTANRFPGGVPTLRWMINRTVQDHLTLTIPADVPAGLYMLKAKLMPCSTLRLIVCDHASIIGTAPINNEAPPRSQTEPANPPNPALANGAVSPQGYVIPIVTVQVTN